MCKSRLFRCCLVALLMLLYALPAPARSPHGALHAKERICNSLKARGVTRGLHGLCVSYCQAHDSDVAGKSAQARSHGKHFRRGWSRRSNHILAHYNRLKKRGDPEMPCNSEPAADPPPVPAPVVQVCPCWTPAEAGAIDGLFTDGSTAAGWPAPTSSASACGVDLSFPYMAEDGFVGGLRERAFIQVVELSSPSMNRCQYQTYLNGQIASFVSLSVEEGTLTAEELAACRSDLVARQATLGLCQPTP